MAPMVPQPAPYAANYTFNWLAAAGTACALATIAAALVLRVSVGMYIGILGRVLKQLAFSLLTIACVLGLAYVMNYSGAVVTLGLAFAATGVLFPFFSALVGWLGVFLTGSDTSANALFGNLQVVTANSLGFDPAIMAASNSSGGVMGKMISLQSLAVAVAATGMARSRGVEAVPLHGQAQHLPRLRARRDRGDLRLREPDGLARQHGSDALSAAAALSRASRSSSTWRSTGLTR